MLADQLIELPSVTDICRAFGVPGNTLSVDAPVMPYRPGHLASEVPVLRASFHASALHSISKPEGWTRDPVMSYAP